VYCSSIITQKLVRKIILIFNSDSSFVWQVDDRTPLTSESEQRVFLYTRGQSLNLLEIGL